MCILWLNVILGLALCQNNRDKDKDRDNLGEMEGRTRLVGNSTRQKDASTGKTVGMVILNPPAAGHPTPSSKERPVFKLARQMRDPAPDVQPRIGLTAQTPAPAEVSRACDAQAAGVGRAEGREDPHLSVAAPRAVSAMTKALEFWENELESDIHRTYVLEGIEFGFSLVDDKNISLKAHRRNYRSVLENFDIVEHKIKQEILLKRYIVCNAPPPRSHLV